MQSGEKNAEAEANKAEEAGEEMTHIIIIIIIIIITNHQQQQILLLLKMSFCFFVGSRITQA